MHPEIRSKFLAFDIETVKCFPSHACDWRLHRPLGISCAATLTSDDDTPRIWHGGWNHARPRRQMDRREARRLVRYLARKTKDGYTIVSWNGLGFDFDVLAEESELRETCKRLARDHVDLMFHVFCRLGHCLSLTSAAEGMALPGKMDGMTSLAAPKLWAEGKRKQVLRYVVQDVRLTLALAEICETVGQIRWVTRSGRKRQMALLKGWLPVRSAKQLPEPITFWMTARLPRTQFTAWLD